MISYLYYLAGKMLWYWEKIKFRLLGAYCNTKYNREINCGERVRFVGFSKITGCDKITIGNNFTMAENAFIKGEGGLTIGDNCHISRNLVLYTHNHNYKGSALPYDNTFIYKKVVIEDNVWIGINVTIMPGSIIGEGAIIGAGTVVRGRVEKMSIYGSAENRVIKTRDTDHYNDLKRKGIYGGLNGVPIPVV